MPPRPKLVEFVAIGLVLVAAVLGFVLSHRAGSSASTTSVRSAPAAAGVSSSGGATGGTLPTNVQDPVLIGSKLRYFDDSALAIKEYDLVAHTNQLIAPLLPNEDAPISWAANGSRLLARLVVTSPAWSSIVADQTATTTTLNPAATAPTFNPTGSKLAYQSVDQLKGTVGISIADSTGKNATQVATAPHPFSQLWFGPVDTYLVALDGTATPPEYDEIGISSKSIQKLASGYGELKWSPSGKLALLDSTDGKSVTIATLGTQNTTTVSVATTVDRLAWESETSLVGLVGNDLVRLDLTKRTSTTIGKGVASGHERAGVIGISQGTLVSVEDGTVLTTPIPKP